LAFTCSSIQNGFRASGLVPLNPTEVLERLLVDIFNELATWILEILYNIFDLTQQSIAVGQLICYNLHSLSSPIVYTIGQLVKGYQLAIY